MPPTLGNGKIVQPIGVDAPEMTPVPGSGNVIGLYQDPSRTASG